MGYTTAFEGEFKLDCPLEDRHRLYLIKFAETRRMKRNAAIAGKMPDPHRILAGPGERGEVGPDGCYFVGGRGFMGQDHDDSVIDYNEPPEGQPGLWCQWVPNNPGTAIVWNGGEKFYDYVPWLKYLIEHFLAPWGYRVNGRVMWQGEDMRDRGAIVVIDNDVAVVDRTDTKKPRVLPR